MLENDFSLAKNIGAKIPILDKDIPLVEAELVDMSDVEEMTLAQFQNEKKALEIKRKNLALRLDGRKLKQAEQIMDAMDMTLGRILEGYDREAVPAQDLHFLTSAYERLTKTLNMVSRLDTIDGTGKSARISLEIRYDT